MGKLLKLLCCGRCTEVEEEGFSPLDVSSLALWLDAQDTGSLTFNSTDISQWNDKSGNNNHAANATGSQQPLYVASAINGHPALYFADDGTFKLLSSPDAASLNYTAFACFAVIQRTADSGTTDMILGKWSETSPSAQREFRLLVNGGDAFQCVSSISGTSSSGTATAPTPATLLVGTAYIAEGSYGSATLSARISNNIAGTASPASIFNGTSPFHLGARDGGSTKYNGYIGEVLFYTAVPTGPQRTQILEYLAAKWGITLA